MTNQVICHNTGCNVPEGECSGACLPLFGGKDLAASRHPATIVFMQQDAAFLWRQWRDVLDSGKPACEWVAAQIQRSAAHSAKLAREMAGIK